MGTLRALGFVPVWGKAEMTRPAAPSMPTERQIKDALAAVRELCPDARIKSVGPDGVTFEYPSGKEAAGGQWNGKPFAA